MSWKAGYFIASGIYQASLLIGAAYFHNGWSVLFVLLAVLQSASTAQRIKEWA